MATNNIFLAPDNVNALMNQLQQRLPDKQLDLQALVNFMQQLVQQYPLIPGTDPKNYQTQLNQYTVNALINYFNTPQQVPQNQRPPELRPEQSAIDKTQETQELGRLVDQLKRERNYSSPQTTNPPVRSFTEPQIPQEQILDQVKDRIKNEREINGSIRSVNLSDILTTNPQQETPMVQAPARTRSDRSDRSERRDIDNTGSTFTERLLSLDYRTDVVDWDAREQAIFKFPLMRRVQAIELVSIALEEHQDLINQPYLYFSLETPDWSLNSAVMTGNKQQTFFGKLIPQERSRGHFINYRLEDPAPQFLPQPVVFSQLTIGLFDYQTKPINLRRIHANQIVRLDKNKIQLELRSSIQNRFKQDDFLTMIQKREDSVVAYKNRILESDQRKLIIQYQSPDLNQLSIYRYRINGHLTIKLTLV